MKAPFIVPIPKDDLMARVNYMQGNKYYLAFETDHEKAYSVYFRDLVWLRGAFGHDLEKINEGRLNEIEHLKQCIEYNIPMFELGVLENITEENKVLLKEKGHIKRHHSDKSKYDVNKFSFYSPQKLGDFAAERFQKDIDRGLLVLCELDYFAVGSEYVSKHGWGDIGGYETPDNKKAVFKITDIIDDQVMFTINYKDNSTPNKIHTESITDFKENMKPMSIDQFIYG